MGQSGKSLEMFRGLRHDKKDDAMMFHPDKRWQINLDLTFL